MTSILLIGRRLLSMISLLLGVSLLTFFILGVLPGSTAHQLLGADATPEQVARLEAELGTDRPAAMRYWEWLTDMFRGDLGNSLTSGQPVATLLWQRAPVSLALITYALVLSISLALPLALFSVYKPNGWIDHLTGILCITAVSVPSYVLAPILVLMFSVQSHIFPSIGFTPFDEGVLANIRSLTLPATAIAVPLLGLYARFLRGDLIDQLHGEAYVLTALAKGIGRWSVLVRHALRNSLFGLLALVGMNIGFLIGGTVIIEQLFALPGMGELLLHAVNTRDTVVVQAVVLVLAVVTVTVNLCVDCLAALLDPRIRYGNP